MDDKKLKESQEMKETTVQEETSSAVADSSEVSENWAEETIADLDDFIESQGIYIRQ